jgi:excisionase family DNA binding protein
VTSASRVICFPDTSTPVWVTASVLPDFKDPLRTVAQVAQLLNYGESKVRMLIITGQLRSIKDGRSRRILPEWVEAYVQDRAKSTEDIW